jgi:hypothetical protein
MLHKWLLSAVILVSAGGCTDIVPTLPPVELTLRPLQDVTFGPSLGLPGGTPLAGTELALTPSCVWPSEADLRDLIRRQAGELVAGFVDIDRVDFDSLRVRATVGSFNTITGVTLGLQSDKFVALADLSLGQITSPDGLGIDFTLTADSPVDLLPFLSALEGDCASIVIRVTGRMPREDVVFLGDVTLTVHGDVVI